jgi:hypothetical protein
MAYSLHEIDWCDVPLLKPMPDLAWGGNPPSGSFCSNIAKYQQRPFVGCCRPTS